MKIVLLYTEGPKKCIHMLIEVIYGHNHKVELMLCIVCSVIFSQKLVLVMIARITLSNGSTVYTFFLGPSVVYTLSLFCYRCSKTIILELLTS
jgi:hypothetical protein